MIRFECDYLEGTHPKILQRLLDTNMEQAPGYGEDTHSENARTLIKEACECPDASVHFLAGGTLTNLTVISSLLRPHEGPFCAASGHIYVHETGAIESTGHKVLALPTENGKLTAAQIEDAYLLRINDVNYEHTVKPGMVYISQPAENGLVYSKSELEELHSVCRKYELPLFIDGARLGYALASPTCDMTLSDIAHNCDVFYIGGTKVGALLGEAVVFPNKRLSKDFRYLMKQHGALLAKGKIMGVTFETLFTDNLYLTISRQAIDLALRLRRAFADKGYELWGDSLTNQQFVIMENAEMERLSEKYSFAQWEPYDKAHTVVRFVTSWATTTASVDALIADLKPQK